MYNKLLNAHKTQHSYSVPTGNYLHFYSLTYHIQISLTNGKPIGSASLVAAVMFHNWSFWALHVSGLTDQQYLQVHRAHMPGHILNHSSRKRVKQSKKTLKKSCF